MIESKKFVVHKHSREGQEVHWDLMLECGEGLATYRLEVEPVELMRGVGSSATKIFTHDLKFLSYEGPVNGGKGSVVMVDKGSFIEYQINGKVVIEFDGEILRGEFEMVCIEGNNYRFGLVGS